MAGKGDVFVPQKGWKVWDWDSWTFTTDDTLTVTPHKDQKEIKVAMKLLVIMVTSLLLTGLMVSGLGIIVEI